MKFTDIPFSTLYDKLDHLSKTNAAIAINIEDVVSMLSDRDIRHEFPAPPAIELHRNKMYGIFHGMRVYVRDAIQEGQYITEAMMVLL